MFKNKNRIKTYLETIIKETQLISEMSNEIKTPNDFLSSLNGMIAFRACGMSLQYVTETFIKIRNLTGVGLFNQYKEIPWKEVFGMRNFISHGYSDVDETSIFNTIKTDIPALSQTTRKILDDLNNNRLDNLII